MMTNARSSAHLNTGKIDLVQQWLDENMPIQSMVMWRQDLSARLDSQHQICLAYPGLLTGAAALSLLVCSQFGSEENRISSIINSFLVEQYRKDEEVKFRQTDLANSLLSLFVDVPAEVSAIISASQNQSRENPGIVEAILNLRSGGSFSRESMVYEGGSTRPSILVGTADLLLSAEVQEKIPLVMLQGAPGQGKSTLAQYVCQVHRARHLGRADFIAKLPKLHVGSAFRFPIKVDLRDVASFFDGQGFLSRPAESDASARTFEKFLAHQIAIQSGGTEFSVDDLRIVLQKTPALVFLDGLDEIANIGLRESVVGGIVASLHRLSAGGANLQAVMTTRPSQLGKVPRYSKEFVRVTLAPIGEATVHEYARKWTAAKRLERDRTTEVLEILREKLSLSHIRELTKNPMQLTILLNLILSIGHSLPDVRTDLYSKYVDLFMTREAEKDAVVRRNQPLLLKIVEYLAWRLQNEAESNRSNGRISEADLKELVGAFLDREGHGREILDNLFDRGLERIYVIVQRVEGEYEFEVQPLREYFTAKYLYSSAPVASLRSEYVQGDRAQRFEAIAANPYWANVTRFYAGFYQGGEIGALAASLKELIGSADLATSLNARSIGVMLISDRTFSSKRSIQAEVVSMVFDSVGVYLSAFTRSVDPLALPEDSGRGQLGRLIFAEHIQPDLAEPIPAVCTLLRSNLSQEVCSSIRNWVLEVSDRARTNRLRTAISCGVVEQYSRGQIREILESDETPEAERIFRLRLFVARSQSAQNLDEDLASEVFSDVLDRGGFGAVQDDVDLSWISDVLSGNSPVHRETVRSRGPLQAVLNLSRHASVQAAKKEMEELFSLDQSQPRLHGFSFMLMNDLDYWSSLILVLEKDFGGSWAVRRLAISLVGMIQYGEHIPQGHVSSSSSLLTALGARRSKRGSPWWSKRIDLSGQDRVFWIAVLLAWGPGPVLNDLVEKLNVAVDELSESDYLRLVDVLLLCGRNRQRAGGGRRKLETLERSSRPRLACALEAAESATLHRVRGMWPETVAFPRLSFDVVVESILAGVPSDTVLREGGLALSLPSSFLEVRRCESAYMAQFQSGADLPKALSGADPIQVIGLLAAYPTVVIERSFMVVQAGYAPAQVQDVVESESWVFS